MTVGIDYGLGKVNIDSATDIRYGVIPAHVLGQAWYDSSEGDYGNPTCPDCASDLILHAGVWVCENCDKMVADEWDTDELYPESPLAWVFEDAEYSMIQYGDDCDIFVTKSPFYTLCSFCSPCAPGAGYVMDQVSAGVKAYCLGPDWFDNDPPFAVYSVETGRQV